MISNFFNILIQEDLRKSPKILERLRERQKEKSLFIEVVINFGKGASC